MFDFLDSRLLAIPMGLALILLIQLAIALWPKRIKIRKIPDHPCPPDYELVYADKRTGDKIEGVTYSKMLFDESWGLQGKPDMIFSNGRQMIPLELKSGSVGTSTQPREGDLMQLAIYFRLIEAEYGIRPKEGRLIYNDKMFVIVNSKALQKALMRVLNEMYGMLESGIPPTNRPVSPNFAKCRHCLCRATVCEINEEGSLND